jgi:hypothetical protein
LEGFDSYEALEAYLHGFANFGGDPVPYDFMGTLHLMLALLDNLRANALEAELKDVRDAFTDEQAEFFLKLAGYLQSSPASGAERGAR